MMIPLRRYLIVKEHGVLTYPEGTACAEVLIAGEEGGAQAGLVFKGLFVGRALQVPQPRPGPLERVPRECSRLLPAHGAGAARHRSRAARRRLHHRLPLVGPHGGRGPARRRSCSSPPSRSSARAARRLLYPAHDADPRDGRRTRSGIDYIRYIGAGAVAAGGIINLARALPTIVDSFRASFRDLRVSGRRRPPSGRRTERDIPITVVLVGSRRPRLGHDARAPAPASNLALRRSSSSCSASSSPWSPRASRASWARRRARSAAWPSRR